MASSMFRIDLSDVIIGEGLSRRDSQELASRVVSENLFAIYNNIYQNANRSLKKSRGAYLDGLQVTEVKRLRGRVELVGALANMVEQGATAFDIKEGMAASSKRKIKKGGGWYMTIPFRIGTPNAIGNKGFAGNMPSNLYGVVRRNKAKETAMGGTTVSGKGVNYGQLQSTNNTQLNKREAIKKEDGLGLSAAQRKEYVSKAPLMLGLMRSQKTYEKATQGQYNTFRRISDKSPANSWIHRGIKARRFFDRALRETNMEDLTFNIIDEYLTEIGI